MFTAKTIVTLSSLVLVSGMAQAADKHVATNDPASSAPAIVPVSTSIQVTVRDQTGQPLANAQIEITAYAPVTDSVLSLSPTNGLGITHAAIAAPGKYRAVARWNGLHASRDFAIALGQQLSLSIQIPGACYANCDNSTVGPVLNVNDYICFLNKFASGDTYANCDGSVAAPVLNVNDLVCFLNKLAAGCPSTPARDSARD